MKIIISDKELEIKDDDFKVISPSQIGSVQDSSCTEIQLLDTLDYYAERETLLKSVIEKVRYGGQISISGLDGYLLSRKTVFGECSIESMSKSLYDGRQSISSIHNMRQFFDELGWKHISSNYRGESYNIVQERPKNA